MEKGGNMIWVNQSVIKGNVTVTKNNDNSYVSYHKVFVYIKGKMSIYLTIPSSLWCKI